MNLPRSVVLVEGASDRVALHTLAGRLGRDLEVEGVRVVAMGGITNTRAFATRYGPRGLGLPLAGLYDAAEEPLLRRGLAAAGLEEALEPHGPERMGFYGCSTDLEDELIRALGTEGVEAVIDAAGEAQSLRLLAGMPAQRRLDARGGAAALPRLAGRDARRAMRRCWSVPSTPSRCPSRWPRCSPTSSGTDGRAACAASAASPRGASSATRSWGRCP